MDEWDVALEDIGVLGVIIDGGLGAGYANEVAQFGKEQLVIGAFSGAGMLPAFDKHLYGI